MPLPALSLSSADFHPRGKPTPAPPYMPFPDAQPVPAQDRPPTRASPVSVPSCQKVPVSVTNQDVRQQRLYWQ